MSIFKDITHRYCKKIWDAYKTQADDKTYKGKEATLLIKRNEFARDLVRTIQQIEVTDNDYATYFDQVLNEINSALKKVAEAVDAYNKEHKTTFTADLYETLYTPALISFINALSNLVKNSPPTIVTIKDKTLFNQNRDAPFIYYFTSVLYEYILDKEFDFATTKVDRDIFDAKKSLILKYVQNAGALFTRFEEDESNAEYQELMQALLNSMTSDEKVIQRRKTEEPSPSYMSLLSQTFYKASEKIVGTSQLGQKMELLTKQFGEKAKSKEFTVS